MIIINKKCVIYLIIKQIPYFNKYLLDLKYDIIPNYDLEVNSLTPIQVLGAV